MTENRKSNFKFSNPDLSHYSNASKKSTFTDKIKFQTPFPFHYLHFLGNQTEYSQMPRPDQTMKTREIRKKKKTINLPCPYLHYRGTKNKNENFGISGRLKLETMRKDTRAIVSIRIRKRFVIPGRF